MCASAASASAVWSVSSPWDASASKPQSGTCCQQNQRILPHDAPKCQNTGSGRKSFFWRIYIKNAIKDRQGFAPKIAYEIWWIPVSFCIPLNLDSCWFYSGSGSEGDSSFDFIGTRKHVCHPVPVGSLWSFCLLLLNNVALLSLEARFTMSYQSLRGHFWLTLALSCSIYVLVAVHRSGNYSMMNLLIL